MGDVKDVLRAAPADVETLGRLQRNYGAVCAELQYVSGLVDGRDATIARLTAELAEAQSAHSEALATTDRIVRKACEDVAAASAGGARMEREATIADMLAVARETHPLAQPAVCEAMGRLGKLVKARGEGGAG